jgi:hypothetical protein
MSCDAPIATHYRVEVSGWDSTEDFFVENTDLAWSEERGQKVYLRHALRQGAVVFVRLLHPTARGHSFPIPYLVEKVHPGARAGSCQVCLAQLRPRSGEAPTQIGSHKLELAEQEK